MIYPKQASQIREVDGLIQMWFGKWEMAQFKLWEDEWLDNTQLK